jgi:outer membrane protein assembly factor BamB/cytochrome c5
VAGIFGSWKRVLVVALALVAIAMLVAACGGGSSSSSTTETTAEAEAPKPAEEEAPEPEPEEEEATSEPSEGVATNWELPNATQTETRDVASEIKESNVGELGVAWTSPIIGNGSYGGWSTTPVVVNNVVYGQDLESNVYAIDYATGKVLWIKKYNKPNTGPDGITVSDGVVYGATNANAFALNAETGEQMWSKKLPRNANEGIDMAPGINEGTVYVSTVPGNSEGFYKGNGQAILWAMDAKTGAVKWKWDEVPTNLWGNPKVNSGGGQWEPPAFDAEGNVYIDVANPAPFPGNPPTGKPKEPWGSSRPGPDLYTDSVVKLDKDTGKMDWYYQLTPHDIQDHDLNNAPEITEGAAGEQIVISAGKGGIAFAVNAETGKLLWETPVGVHNGHDKDNLYAMHHEYNKLPKPGTPYNVEPGEFGGVETPYATDGKTTFFPILNWPTNFTTQSFATFEQGTGELVAVDNETGKIVWDHKFKEGDYGAATVSNDLVWTSTFGGKLYALNIETGEVVWSTQLPAGTNSPIAINEDTVIAGAAYAQGKDQEPLIVAYKLGATGKLPTEEGGAKAGGEEAMGGGKEGGGGKEEAMGGEKSGAEGGSSMASVAKGEEVFGTTCATCHTLAAAGATGTVGPNLDELKPDKALVEKQVTNGGGGMPAFGSALSKEEIESVAEFVSGAAGKPLTAEQKKKAAENGGGGGAP